MKKLSFVLSISLLVISFSTFAKQHFYQQLCNYTQKPLLITATEIFQVHPKSLNGAQIAPNQCSTYRYVVGSHVDIFNDKNSFQEDIYLQPSLTRIARLRIFNKQWDHKKTTIAPIYLTYGYKVELGNHLGRHYTINVKPS